MVDAIDGGKVAAKAYTDVPESGTTYDELDDVTTVGDIAVTSHCLSRFWGEMQEAYWADAAGRVYRWDLAAEVSNVGSFPHKADSGGKWPIDSQGFALATPALELPACRGKDEFACTVSAIQPNSSRGDVFSFAPAVTANHRIDNIEDPGEVLALGDRDQFLIALVSGSPNDDAIDGGDVDNDFHSSIYLIVDDHRQDPSGGFKVPGHAPVTAPGAHKTFMRLPLSDIERTRHVDYPDGSASDQTRVFSKRARPLRAPQIYVTGVADGTQQVDASVYYISYMIYEPGDTVCDPRWFDEDTNEWVYDSGTTYEIIFRLALGDDQGFDFQTDYSLPSDPNDGFGSSGALGAPIVRQLDSCANGNCGPTLEARKISPCDPNGDPTTVGGAISIQTGYGELNGFSPLEIPL
jgi:hypothetical protein